MSIRLNAALAGTAAIALLVTTSPSLAQSAPAAPEPTISPALCGPGDVREPGIQGEVPAGQTPNYNCGVRLIGQLSLGNTTSVGGVPLGGNVAATGRCAYVRGRGTQDDSQMWVLDMRNPTRPVAAGEPIPVHMNSESLRLVVTPSRAVLVSGSSVFDISDCLHPRRLGEIKWPDTTVPGVTRKNLPHDIRINREGTKVYASFGLWEADISNLADPATWTITDHRCEIAAQVPGPWQDVHARSLQAGLSLCDDAKRKAPMGANYAMGGSPLQASLLWPQFSHSIDFNADDTRLYAGDQAGGTMIKWSPQTKVSIVDITTKPYRIIGQVDGPGHGLDWFRVGNREYVIHDNEGGSKGILGQPQRGDTCQPYPRPSSLGWGFEAFISDVTDPAQARNVSMARIAINDPQNCAARKASGRDPWLAYHLIDNPLNPHFAALNFGDAGLRIFDIRDPLHPTEVAYFNHGGPVHAGVGYYDPARKLIYFSDTGGFKVLQIEPQVVRRLGL